ncbi:hypothetical protein FCH28_08765 [Streptomyces piniterrae]|uniref:Uncharacterized protein n=1 Tax=Streptomyces piniterrae TaxID=2571125 RepID=A0A4U0NM32_9ACTN|nr:hypothetical protein FCH28_08765 [Streptomyces piniterrae]
MAVHDALSSAQVTVTRADRGTMLLPSACDAEALLWKRVPGGLPRDERQEAEEWARPRAYPTSPHASPGGHGEKPRARLLVGSAGSCGQGRDRLIASA